MKKSKDIFNHKLYRTCATCSWIGGLIVAVLILFAGYQKNNEIELVAFFVALAFVGISLSISLAFIIYADSGRIKFIKEHQQFQHHCNNEMELTDIEQLLAKNNFQLEKFGKNEMVAFKRLCSPFQKAEQINCWFIASPDDSEQKLSKDFLFKAGRIETLSSLGKPGPWPETKKSLVIKFKILKKPLSIKASSPTKKNLYDILEQGLWVNSVQKIYVITLGYDPNNQILYYADGLEKVKCDARRDWITVEGIRLVHELFGEFL